MYEYLNYLMGVGTIADAAYRQGVMFGDVFSMLFRIGSQLIGGMGGLGGTGGGFW